MVKGIDMSWKKLYICTPKRTTPFSAKKFKLLLKINCNWLICNNLQEVLSECKVH